MIRAVLWPAALTLSLFAGPMLQSCLSRTQTAHCHSQQLVQSLRNLVVAPLTEEVCFRACMAPLFLLEVSNLLAHSMVWLRAILT